MSTWTQAQKDVIVEAWLAEDPTADTVEEILTMLSQDTADDEEPRSINAIRRILSNAGVYIKKQETKAKEAKGDKKVRVTPKSKALTRFAEVCKLNDVEFSLDSDDTNKMTAKILEAVIDLVGQVGEALPED